MAIMKLIFLFYGLSIESLPHKLHVDVLRTVEVHLNKKRKIKCSPGVLWRGVYWDRLKLRQSEFLTTQHISEEVSLKFL